MTHLLSDLLIDHYSFTYIAHLAHVFEEDISDGSNLRSVLVIILAYCLVPIQLHSPLFTPAPLLSPSEWCSFWTPSKTPF